MKIFSLCERSGIVREAFRARGHDAWSVDLEPCEDGCPFHIQDDIRNVNLAGSDLWLAFPDCTYLTVSGLHWNGRISGRADKTEKALDFVQWIFDEADRLDVALALENPVTCISTRIRKPDQIIQPFQFGHDASKKTCLWLRKLKPLRLDPAQFFPPRYVNGKPRWSNQTDSGQNRLGPSDTRAMDRARTYQGIANAFAVNWG